MTIAEIIDAFPDECRSMIPGVNMRLKREIKPFTCACKRIRNRHYEYFKEQFLIGAMRALYNPDKIKKQIKRNESILKSLDGSNNGRITEAMIKQAKDVKIATLYSFQNIKAGHARFSACCPFHNEKTGSFFVYPDNTFYCFGCHVGGDNIAFVRKLNGFNFPESVRYLLHNE